MPAFPYSWFNLQDSAVAELSAGISAVDTTLTVKSGQGIKFPSTDFIFRCGNEWIHCATRTNDTFSSLTRGYDGSTPALHLINAVVFQSAGKSLFQRIYDNLNAHAHTKADISDFAHNHAQGDIASLVTDLAGKASTSHNHDAAYSAINHTHAGGSDPFATLVAVLAADVSTGANVTPVNVTGLVFSYVANARYVIEVFGRRSAAAATTGMGLQLDVSTAVDYADMTFFHGLTAAGGITGGYAIADDASVGVSSGVAGTAIVPFYASGVLDTAGNAGSCQLRYRSEVAAVSTIRAGTVMRVHRVA